MKRRKKCSLARGRRRRRRTRSKRDFSELPIDILSAIIGKTSTLSDFIWFGSVCVSWRSASLANPKHISLPSSLPLLLLPSSSLSENGTRSLHSLSGKVHDDWKLPVGSWNCRGCSHGWLILASEANEQFYVRLLNPFLSLNNEIELPPLTAMELDDNGDVFDSNYMFKAVISANPSSTFTNPKDLDIVVMAIHGFDRLSFCKPGDKVWAALPFEWRPFDDVIYYQGLFYVILSSGTLVSIKLDPIRGEDVKLLINIPLGDTQRKYIVESSGKLLQVKRKIIHDFERFKYSTVEVKVFEMDLTGSDDKWVEIKNLDGRMLFLGHNTSISLLASDFPGCKPNCIYFTDDNEYLYDPSHYSPHDIGIYNLEDGSFEPHYPMQTETIITHPYPIWIQPKV